MGVVFDRDHPIWSTVEYLAMPARHSAEHDILGLVGEQGVGKSTIALFLGHHGYQKLSFADALREHAKFVYGLTDEEVTTRKTEVIERYGKTGREILQFFGTDYVRDWVSKTFWVDQVKNVVRHKGLYVIDDVRFPNEADMIKGLGGRVVRLERDGHGATGDQHASELGQREVREDELLTMTSDGYRTTGGAPLTTFTYSDSVRGYIE